MSQPNQQVTIQQEYVRPKRTTTTTEECGAVFVWMFVYSDLFQFQHKSLASYTKTDNNATLSNTTTTTPSQSAQT